MRPTLTVSCAVTGVAVNAATKAVASTKNRAILILVSSSERRMDACDPE
jgi:hypothetical protein